MKSSFRLGSIGLVDITCPETFLQQVSNYDLCRESLACGSGVRNIAVRKRVQCGACWKEMGAHRFMGRSGSYLLVPWLWEWSGRRWRISQCEPSMVRCSILTKFSILDHNLNLCDALSVCIPVLLWTASKQEAAHIKASFSWVSIVKSS